MQEESFPRGRGERKEQPTEGEKRDRSSSRRRGKKDVESPKKRGSDFLFGGPESDTKAKKPKKRKKSVEKPSKAEASALASKSLMPLGGGAVVHPSKGESWIEGLGFSKLAKGFKLLGCVREVHEDLAIFSLPNMWTAFMLRQGDTPCNAMLSVGQFVSVVIVKAAQEHTKDGFRRRIQVSCLPAMLNPPGAVGVEGSPFGISGTSVRCQVQSIEDHGLLMDLGAGRRGFLPFSEIKREYTLDEGEEDADDHPGKLRLSESRVLDCLVRSSSTKTTGILPLALESEKKTVQQTVPSSFTPTLAQLNPGMLVHTKVECMARNGLCVSFCGNMFRGAVEVQHLGGFWVPDHRNESTEWKSVFDKNRSLMARIIAVDSATKIVRLSIQSHVLEMKHNAGSLPSVGTVCKDATVVRLDAGIGALLALPSSKDDMDIDEISPPLFKPVSTDESYTKVSHVKAVYVHISKAMDPEEKGKKTPESLFAKEFAPSTKHSVRILSTANWIDGIASGATASSIVEAHVLTHADLVTGQIYKQVPVCAQLEGGGVLVDFGMGVRGLIPEVHLFDKAVASDYRQKMRKVKYSVGAKVDVRILKIDPRSKRCLVTAKKSMLKATNVLQYFDDVRVGDIGTGYISKVDDQGLIVTFFNGVYGRVTTRSLSLELGVEDHRRDYSVGDVLECRITQIRTKQRNPVVNEEDSDDEMDTEGGSSRRFKELTLSLKLDGEIFLAEDDESTEHPHSPFSTIVQLRVGALLPEKSMRVVELVNSKQKENGYVPGYAIVNIKSKHLVDEAESATTVPYFECKLPFDQLLDDYKQADIESPTVLDALAKSLLAVGKQVDQKGFILFDPKKSRSEFLSGTGKLTVVSIRQKLVAALENQTGGIGETADSILPDPTAHLFKGGRLVGYVANIDKHHGAFVRYLNGLTGLVPKKKGGLLMPLYQSVETEIIAIDITANPPKLLVSASLGKGGKNITDQGIPNIKPGDVIHEAVIKKLDFHRLALQINDKKMGSKNGIKARLHCTMAQAKEFKHSSKPCPASDGPKISKVHPFYKMKVGQKMTNLRVASVEFKGKKCYVELTNREDGSDQKTFIEKASELSVGQKVSGIVSSVVPGSGVWVEISPAVTCHIPALEISTDAKVLNSLPSRFPVGCRIECNILDKTKWRSNRAKYRSATPHQEKASKQNDDFPMASLLYMEKEAAKPTRGDLVVGRVNRSLPVTNAPAVMLDLRGGFVARCCITELEEQDDWTNLPLGHPGANNDSGSTDQKADNDHEMDSESDDEQNPEDKMGTESSSNFGLVPHGKFVQCRVLNVVPGTPMVEVSLRESRIEGDLDADEKPEVGEKIQAYVVATTKKGCFVRVSRQVEGRVILKELCDGFLPDPASSFPAGRLVVGKVKAVHTTKKKKKSTTTVDLDMRESVLLEDEEKLKYDDVEVGHKYKGSVTRIEEYGVFVRLENSDVSGLVHKSECSDNYIKKLAALYDPGDLVKVLVLKKDEDSKRIGFSMKASHFEDDDSDDDSSVEDAGLLEEDIDSDDEDYVSKLAASMADKNDEGVDQKIEDDSDSSESASSDDNNSEGDDMETENGGGEMDTNVGFDWGVGTLGSKSKENDLQSGSEDESSSESEDEDDVHKSSHKSRRKQAQRRREEQEITRRETALADGTADENPETASDFERLLASSPNSSEIWIRYMAFHLTLADISAAREVANRAFSRIEFREEREKLNVWCALLTLELKYGTEADLQETIDRACQQNNPKHVYLRVCEMLEKDSASSGFSVRAAEMYSKMCKKFRGKKKVWLAHMKYLLKTGRQEDAYTLSKRAMKSLPSYKHVETMSKFAQLVFEYGSPERARTLFDGLLLKYKKRMDLLFVYVDKEVKHGDVDTARNLFKRVANPADQTLEMKLSDKQMKSFFKKWYAFEELHGTEKTQEEVKDAARHYVERSLEA